MEINFIVVVVRLCCICFDFGFMCGFLFVFFLLVLMLWFGVVVVLEVWEGDLLFVIVGCSGFSVVIDDVIGK